MRFPFWCPRCGRRYEARRDQVGRRARCRTCGTVQRVPEPLDPPEAPLVFPVTPGDTSTTSPTPSAPPPLPRTEEAREREATAINRLRAYLAGGLHVEGLATLLVVLSTADVFLTYTLLRTSPRFFESNPVAAWVFHRWNIAGMAIFKFAVIGFAIATAEYIERKRPGLGKLVLAIGCLAAAVVLWHGLRLYLGGVEASG